MGRPVRRGSGARLGGSPARAPCSWAGAVRGEAGGGAPPARRGWGRKRRRAMLAARAARGEGPAASTIGELLRREGLSQPRRRVRYVMPVTTPPAAATAPNDVWTTDFKGWFRTTDGTRCDPLTVADACSRFGVCCRVRPLRRRG